VHVIFKGESNLCVVNKDPGETKRTMFQQTESSLEANFQNKADAPKNIDAAYISQAFLRYPQNANILQAGVRPYLGMGTLSVGWTFIVIVIGFSIFLSFVG
jgi:hypothetical protein